MLLCLGSQVVTWGVAQLLSRLRPSAHGALRPKPRTSRFNLGLEDDFEEDVVEEERHGSVWECNGFRVEGWTLVANGWDDAIPGFRQVEI